eukprot:CAMPEP_0115748704 /NCGR_PEP_ID=MMETSP0272-20121206/93812_1 /TAXON_ID=71861 /ORGANISM="Scrippsiella trochoidea, Strain CCMP3099" /LENGTH=89 /DNA_ID=CAMNT_0003193729 /DNA_START=527 /DNA_END=792 /DNA_ORIENTATION=-
MSTPTQLFLVGCVRRDCTYSISPSVVGGTPVPPLANQEARELLSCQVLMTPRMSTLPTFSPSVDSTRRCDSFVAAVTKWRPPAKYIERR